jgi:hypothetical protein
MKAFLIKVESNNRFSKLVCEKVDRWECSDQLQKPNNESSRRREKNECGLKECKQSSCDEGYRQLYMVGEVYIQMRVGLWVSKAALTNCFE